MQLFPSLRLKANSGPLFSNGQSEFKKNKLQKELQKYKSKMCISSYYGALIQLIYLKPINPPHAHQKPIQGGHFHHSKACSFHHHTQTFRHCFDAPTTVSPPLKKFCNIHHYKVIEDPWRATPTPTPSPSISMA